MRCRKKMFLIILLLIIPLGSSVCAEKNKSRIFGFVLVAHGSNNQAWNDQIKALYDLIDADHKQPSRLAFLRFGESSVKEAINSLKNQDNATDILLVHLSPSSYSERHYDLIEEVSAIDKADTSIALRVSPAMDNHPLAIKILLDHARPLSQNPEQKSLILVGYGPVGELENIMWLRQLNRIGKKIKRRLGLRKIVGMTLRHHSCDLIRKQAIVNLQKTANRLKKNGKVIVVPQVLGQGSFFDDLQSYLGGLDFPEQIAISDQNMISHQNTQLWVEKIIQQGMDQQNSKTINRRWSAMNAAMNDNCQYEYGRAEIIKHCEGKKQGN